MCGLAKGVGVWFYFPNPVGKQLKRYKENKKTTKKKKEKSTRVEKTYPPYYSSFVDLFLYNVISCTEDRRKKKG